jgi:hypothetical protein
MIAEACSIGRKEAVRRAPEFSGEALCTLPHAFPLSSVVEAFLRFCVSSKGLFSDERGDRMRGSVPALMAGHIEGRGIRAQVRLQCFEYWSPILRILRRAARIFRLFTCE